MLINWKMYLQMIKKIKDMTTSGITKGRRTIALNAREQLSPLDTSKFFVCYPTLIDKRMKIDIEINFLVHNTKKYLNRSVLAHFETLFPNQTVKLKDKSKEFCGVHVCNYYLLYNCIYVF